MYPLCNGPHNLTAFSSGVASAPRYGLSDDYITKVAMMEMCVARLLGRSISQVSQQMNGQPIVYDDRKRGRVILSPMTEAKATEIAALAAMKRVAQTVAEKKAAGEVPEGVDLSEEKLAEELKRQSLKMMPKGAWSQLGR